MSDLEKRVEHWLESALEWLESVALAARPVEAKADAGQLGGPAALSQTDYDNLVRDAMKWRSNDERIAELELALSAETSGLLERAELAEHDRDEWEKKDESSRESLHSEMIRAERAEADIEKLKMDAEHLQYERDEAREKLAAEPEPGLRDSQRLDWIEHVMTYDDNYVEVYLSGLRNQTGKATAFQVEVNPEKIATLNAPTLREAIDAAQGKWEREVTEEHAARTPPPAEPGLRIPEAVQILPAPTDGALSASELEVAVHRNMEVPSIREAVVQAAIQWYCADDDFIDVRSEWLEKAVRALPEFTGDDLSPPSSWPTNEAESEAETKRALAPNEQVQVRVEPHGPAPAANTEGLREAATEMIRITRHIGASQWDREKAADALDAALAEARKEKV